MDEKIEKNPKSFKVVLLGESGVGKTSILNRFIKGIFTGNIVSTMGACFFSKIFGYFLDFPYLCKIYRYITYGHELIKFLQK